MAVGESNSGTLVEQLDATWRYLKSASMDSTVQPLLLIGPRLQSPSSGATWRMMGTPKRIWASLHAEP